MSRFVQDKASPGGMRTFSIDTKGELTCLAANKDFTLVACAGRQVFKVYSIEDDKFTEKHNLRPAQKPGLNYVAVDVVWSPRDEHILASASSNGSVVFWDINKPHRNKQDYVSHLHERAASRLCFHPLEPLMLSGGKDGMCKLFDTRRKNVVHSFPSVAVHDVQWWPSQFFVFASATDNGSIQIWDYRNPQSCQVEFPAHSGPVFALNFHPEEKLLASGGRDRLIKVWSLGNPPLNNSCVTQTHSIQTIASVFRVKWRPKRATQIASVGNSFDLGVHVWELARPSVPLATFTEHKDAVTSIIWKDPHEFISGGKDSRLIMHSFKDALRLSERMNPIALSLNINNQFGLAVNEKLQQLAISQPAQSAAAATSSKMLTLFRTSATKPNKRDAFIKDKVSNIFFFGASEQDFNDEWFKYCAKNYVLHGKSFEDMCQHNADVAERQQQIQIMKHWLLLKILFSSYQEPPPFSSHGIVLPTDNPVGLLTRPEVSSVSVDHQMHNHHTENGELTSGVSGDEDTDDHFINPSMAQTISHDFFYEDNEIDGFEMDLDDKDDEFEDEQVFELPTEVFFPSHDLTDTADPHGTSAYHSHQPPLYSADNTYSKDKHSEQRSPEKIRAAAFDVPLWDPVSSVVSLLHSYANSGDVQTAVSMYIVLGAKVKNHIEEEILEGWITSYLDLLEMFRLWCESNTIITKCQVKSISHMNQASTTVYTFCARCMKPLPAASCGWYCKRCRKISSLCSLCHTPVKGLFVWCQGCAHGGHLHHLKEWFSHNKQCPTGCGHDCEFT